MNLTFVTRDLLKKKRNINPTGGTTGLMQPTGGIMISPENYDQRNLQFRAFECSLKKCFKRMGINGEDFMCWRLKSKREEKMLFYMQIFLEILKDGLAVKTLGKITEQCNIKDEVLTIELPQLQNSFACTSPQVLTEALLLGQVFLRCGNFNEKMVSCKMCASYCCSIRRPSIIIYEERNGETIEIVAPSHELHAALHDVLEVSIDTISEYFPSCNFSSSSDSDVCERDIYSF